MEQYVRKNQKTLRCGITTGTCAAAAAKAAMWRLVLGTEKKEVMIQTPKGIRAAVEIVAVSGDDSLAEAAVIKDSGDDPDVTNHARVVVRIERLEDKGKLPKTAFCSEEYPNLYLDGGAGVGRVTKAGLEQEIGQAAINRVPRQMVFQAVGEVCEAAESTHDIFLIEISVPEGEELAKKTFNPRLGIEGGISILGTSGILEPMSEKAILDTIEAEIRQRQAQGEKNLLITPGNYGQSYLAQYLHLDIEKSIKCSNYIGDTLDLAVSYGMENVLLVGNVGKLVKLAAGIMNTHSKVADGRGEIVALHTVLCGGSREMALTLLACINTEEMLKLLEEWKLRQPVTDSLMKKIGEHLRYRSSGRCRIGAMLFSESFGFLGQTKEAEAVLESIRKAGW